MENMTCPFLCPPSSAGSTCPRFVNRHHFTASSEWTCPLDAVTPMLNVERVFCSVVGAFSAHLFLFRPVSPSPNKAGEQASFPRAPGPACLLTPASSPACSWLFELSPDTLVTALSASFVCGH